MLSPHFPASQPMLATLVDRFRARRVAVIGDLIADEFVYGRVTRVSREAPVLILGYDSTTMTPGGAGNAATNITALSGHAQLVGVVGDDDVGNRLVEVIPNGVDLSRLVRVPGIRTSLKTRILAGGAHSARQQVVRIDRESRGILDRDTSEAFERAAVEAAQDVEAVVVSDYGSGLVTPGLIAYLRNTLGRSALGQAVPLPIDSRYELTACTGATLVTPNESELEEALGIRIGDDLGILEHAGRRLLQQLRADAALVTRESRGMTLFEQGRPATHIPVYGTDEVSDVTGAGDTVIATTALAIAAGGSFIDAACLAHYAAGLVVMKRGTATVNSQELREAILASESLHGSFGLASTA